MSSPLQGVDEPENRRRFFYGWYIVGASWVMLFLVSAVGVGIFFKPILEEFGWSRATLSLVHTLALLLFALATPFLGRFIDRFGPRIMLFVNLGTQTLSSVVNGLASGIWHIFIGRFLYEVKALQVSQVLINRWFVEKRGRAQGIAATGMPLGALLLSPLSQFLILAWGWRPTMFFWAGLTFAIAFPLALLIRNSPGEKRLAPDGRSADHISKQPKEVGNGEPLTEFTAGRGHNLAEAAKSKSFWLLLGTQLICGVGCGFMMTHIVIFAADFGYPELVGASLVSVQGGLNLVGVLVTGHVSDRYARNRVLAFTHVFRSLAFLTGVVFILGDGAQLWLLYLAMVLFGFGWFTTSPLTSGLVADLFGECRMGTIIGITMSCHTVGMALGAFAGGITFDLTGSYYSLFLAQTALELLAAGFAFAIKRTDTYRIKKNQA